MSVWTIGQPLGDRDKRFLTNLTTGQRIDFTVDDGALLALMFDSEFPECEECRDRACTDCNCCHEPECCCQCTLCPACEEPYKKPDQAMECCDSVLERDEDEEPSS